MRHSVIDAGLIDAVHLHLADRLDGAPELGDDVVQVGLMADLLAGAYDGTVTLEALLAHGDLGLGTVHGLDGELVIVDGAPFVVRSSGLVDSVALSVRTPFAVVTTFRPSTSFTLNGADRPTLIASVEEHRGAKPIVALRAHGTVASVALRSVERQVPPYLPLTEIVAHQREWLATAVAGTFVGFAFPDALSGIEVGGYHLHFLSDDRAIGGHVIEFDGADLEVEIDGDEELGVVAGSISHLRQARSASRAAIEAVEGR